jgi:hypothetical protein
MVGGLLGAGSFQAWGQETSQVASPKSGKITGIVTAKTDKDITVSGAMHDICFENIRVNDVRQLIHCWIGQDMWGQDSQRGHVDGVLFKNITVTGPDFPRSRLLGFDATHLIENVAFKNVRILGKTILSQQDGKISTNPFVRNLRFSSGD